MRSAGTCCWAASPRTRHSLVRTNF
jgi:hypothetical protein